MRLAHVPADASADVEKRVAMSDLREKRDKYGDVAAARGSGSQYVSQRLRVRNRTLCRGDVHQRQPPPTLQGPARCAANNGDGQRFMLLNMQSYLPVLKAITVDLLITRRVNGYINASGLPLYYRAFVYKLPK